MFKELVIMKKNIYIQPVVETSAISVANIICVSLNAPLTNGGGTDIPPTEAL